jgi:hypothetical protein
MWTVVYMATGLELAMEVENRLKSEGFLIKRKFFSKEGEYELYEILAPEFEAQDVQLALLDLGII